MPYGIVLGYNGTPVALHALAPPLFWRYELGGVEDEMIVPTILAANDKKVQIARYKFTWKLQLRPAERDYLLTNIYTAESVELTIQTPDRHISGEAFDNYNVIGHRPVMEAGTGRPSFGAWLDVLFEFDRGIEAT